MEILVMSMLGLTSVVGLAFIVERALALRWGKVVPAQIVETLAACKSRDDVKRSAGCATKTVAARTPVALAPTISTGRRRQCGRAANRRAP